MMLKKYLQKIGISLTATAMLLAVNMGNPISIVAEESDEEIEDHTEQIEEIKVEESILDSGNHGIDWRLTTDGALYLGEGTLNEMEGRYGNNYPWMQAGVPIKIVVIEGEITLPREPKLFLHMRELLTIENINLLDTSNVEDMGYMFYNTDKLEELDLSSWDTSNVISMKNMFANSQASRLKSIQLENWDVSKVEDMSGIFENAVSIETLDLENWDVSSVKNMSHMFNTVFSSYSKLTTLNISSWDTSNVESMGGMFYNAKLLRTLDISSWDVSNVKYMGNMFSKAEKLEDLDLSNWDVSNVENMAYMFQGTRALSSLNLSGWDVSKVSNMKYMFEASRLDPTMENLNLSNWTLSGITDIDGMFDARHGDIFPSVIELDLSNWNTDKLYNYDFISKLQGVSTLKLEKWEQTDGLQEALDQLLSADSYLTIIGLNYKIIDMEDLTYSDVPDVTYTGKQIKPEVEVYDGEYKLIEGTDYEIIYNDNISNNGNVGVIIRGLQRYNKDGNQYTESHWIGFDILPAKLKLITLPKASSVPKADHISESIITGGKVVDESGKEVKVNYSWDYNNIDIQNVYKTGEYKAYTSMDDYETLYFTLKLEVKEWNGWKKEDNIWYYYKDGDRQTGWIKVNGNWYYMEKDVGAMQTGWTKVKGTWYYMNSSGHMQTGWHKLNGNWFYMSGSGSMQTGWTKVNNTWYYMNSSGHMQTGWTKVNNTWYYMNSSGHMQTGWHKLNGNWFYMSGSGSMQTGWTKVKSTWYYMNSSGAMQTGWLKLGRNWYFLNNNGSMQVQNTTINGRWYRFDSSGRML